MHDRPKKMLTIPLSLQRASLSACTVVECMKLQEECHVDILLLLSALVWIKKYFIPVIVYHFH